MNILVTGANGFIGSHLVSRLGANHQISSLKTDITQPLLGFDKVDAAFHLASYVHRVPKSKADVDTVFKINVEGTRNLLRSFKSPPKTFFFSSTVAIYGREDGVNINENQPPAPVTPYGESKLEAERIIEEWGKREGVTIIIYRLPLVYGAGNKGNMERLVKWINRGFCFTVSDGSNLRSMVHVGNIVDATQKILDCADFKSGVYHMTDERNYTYKEICNTIANALGKKINVISIPAAIAALATKMGDKSLKKISSTLTFDSTRIQKTLQFKPRFGIQDFLHSEHA